MKATPSAEEVARRRRETLLQVLRILVDAGGSLRRKDVMNQLEQAMAFTPWECEPQGKLGKPRWDSWLWDTLGAVRGGYMVKDNGLWSITPAGREVMQEGADRLSELCEEGYRLWSEARSSGTPHRIDGGTGLEPLVLDRVLDELAGMDAPSSFEGLMSCVSATLIRENSGIGAEMLERLCAESVLPRALAGGWLEQLGDAWALTDEGRRAREIDDRDARWARLDERLGGREPVPPYLGGWADFGGMQGARYSYRNDKIGRLVSELAHGTLALPDLQRPFVWKNARVSDLFDTLFRGYPFGFVLTWRSPADQSTHRVGCDSESNPVPHEVVIDGQQRLTSLFAVMTGTPVMDARFRRRKIKLSFHPLKARFAVTDATHEAHPEWVDVTKLLTDSRGVLPATNDALDRLLAARTLTPEQKVAAQNNLGRLAQLKEVTVHVLQIAADANEEEVAEIFVRINSKGQALYHSDFILTLLSVFWPQGRERIEAFSRACREPATGTAATPFNRQVQPEPEDLLRTVIGVGFGRARLASAYRILRGGDAEHGESSSQARERSLQRLREACDPTLDPSEWQEWLKTLSHAGYTHPRLITSRLLAMQTYVLHLIGKHRYHVPLARLRRLLARWFVMSVLTGRYSGSVESRMEEDHALLRPVQGPEEFENVLEKTMKSELTSDFWEVTLPERFTSSSTMTLAPFFAAQGVLGVRALFSHLSIRELLDPLRVSQRSDLEIHHLFPRAWLRRHGIVARTQTNQIANYALLEWDDNLKISDDSPRDYFPRWLERVPEPERDEMTRAHALPECWWEMDYVEFLEARRPLMARILREAWERIE